MNSKNSLFKRAEWKDSREYTSKCLYYITLLVCSTKL